MYFASQTRYPNYMSPNILRTAGDVAALSLLELCSAFTSRYKPVRPDLEIVRGGVGCAN
jgi:hypothetical protein